MFDVCGTTITMSRGDSGLLTIVMEEEMKPEDAAVLTVSKRSRRDEVGDPLLRMIASPLDGEENLFRFAFMNDDTDKWKPDEYYWDLRICKGCVFGVDGDVESADEVQTPFLPSPFIVREVCGNV